MKINVQLFGGEKDGWTEKLDIGGNKRPDLHYVWSPKDDEKIRAAKGQRKAALSAQLAVLAYKFDRAVSKQSGLEYHYRRHPEKDKNPAKTSP